MATRNEKSPLTRNASGQRCAKRETGASTDTPSDVIGVNAKNFSDRGGHADSLTDDERQAVGEALTEYFAALDRDIGIDAPDRILSLFDYHDSRNIDDLIDRVIAPTIATSHVDRHAPIAAQAALAAIETFEIFEDTNWSRKPNSEDRFVLREFIAHLFGGYPVEASAAPQINEQSAKDSISFSGSSLTLSGAQLLEALDFMAPDRDRDQLESELTFQRGAGHAGDGMYCWLTEYPEEGAFFVDGSTAIPAEATLTAKEVAALHVLNEKLRHVDDMGPADEGWQSDKLNAAWTAVDAVLTRSPSGNGTKAGATNDTQVVTVDVRDLFAYLRAAWREGQHYDREDFPDQADSWSAASDYANKTIEKWTGRAPARADARDGLNAEHRDAIEWGITQALIIGDRLRVAQFASLLAVNPSRPKPRAELPHFPLVLRKMWSATDVQRWIDENIAPLINLTQAELDVITERRRQVEQEGWTPAHDDQYRDHELSCAAGCYAMYTLAYPAGDPPPAWPWAADWWKPTTHRRNLVKAGALIQAAIERLDRATSSAGECNAS